MDLAGATMAILSPATNGGMDKFIRKCTETRKMSMNNLCNFEGLNTQR
jgi:hypothetical protein